MEKFDSKKHIKLINDLPFSYVSLPLYLDFCAYTFKRNGEDLIVTQDPSYLHDFPSLFLPKNKDNWAMASMSMITEEEVKKIKKEDIEIANQNPTETEYYYKTSGFLDPKSKMKNRVNQFNKSYDYNILNNYSKTKLTEFYNLWEGQKERSSDLFEKESTEFFFFCLENLEKYDIKQIYVEIDGKLAGFAWGVGHSDHNWAGLHLKANYDYKGLSRFLHHERAKLFSDRDLFSLGTGCHDPGLIQFKKELGPVLEKQYYYVFTRDKNNHHA
ncbi:MAG: hypothetical protein WCV59_02410 [Parcubacteria group bacterium]|jgi:hypothetical protein